MTSSNALARDIPWGESPDEWRGESHVPSKHVHAAKWTDKSQKWQYIEDNWYKDIHETIAAYQAIAKVHEVTQVAQNHSRVNAFVAFRDATAAALVSAIVCGLAIGWVGDKQKVEIVGAVFGAIAYVMVRVFQSHGRRISHVR